MKNHLSYFPLNVDNIRRKLEIKKIKLKDIRKHIEFLYKETVIDRKGSMEDFKSAVALYVYEEYSKNED